MLRVASTLSLLVLAIGCVDVPGEESGDLEETVQELGGSCEEGPCPKNSPVIASVPVWNLNLTPGVPNAQGFAIDRFELGGLVHSFNVSRGRITARWGFILRQGQQLVGGRLWLRRGAKQYVVRITAVVNAPFWARLDPLGPYDQFEAYHFDWTDVINGIPNDRFTNVCDKAMLPRDTRDLMNAPNFVTGTFEGDVIDPYRRRVNSVDTGQFNLGCAGHTIFKMQQMGHLYTSQFKGFNTTEDERTTIMKALGGDYCGGGYAFTVPGMELTWQDDRGWMSWASPVSVIEARWDRNGATCLEIPRVLANATLDSLAIWPADPLDPNFIENAIAAKCTRPPLCANTTLDWNKFDGHHLVTANPP